MIFSVMCSTREVLRERRETFRPFFQSSAQMHEFPLNHFPSSGSSVSLTIGVSVDNGTFLLMH